MYFYLCFTVEFIAFYMNWDKKLQTLRENKKGITEFQSRLHTPIGKTSAVQVRKNEKSGGYLYACILSIVREKIDLNINIMGLD